MIRGKCTDGKAGVQGFTLLELSIVLVLIGIILAMGLVTMTASLQASQYKATVSRMHEIEKALLNFSIANNRIPCPADLTLTSASTNYGFEAGAGSGSAIATATGVCTGTGMLPQANFVAASGAVEGGVPTRALQLPDDYMYDGWGRKFRYAVDPTQTATSALPAQTASLCSGSPTAITVQDASGANRTTAAAYALISHGANGHGGYTSGGGIFSASSVNANELTNCHCTTAGVAGTYTPTYIEMAPTQDPSNALDNFDDIVTFKEPWQMQALNYPLKAANCNLLAVASRGSPYVTLYSFSNGKLTMLPAPTTTPGNMGYAVAFSPDNSLLAWVGQGTSNNEGLLYMVGSSGLTYSSTFINNSYDDEAVAFSSDGNYLAYGGDYPYIGALVKSGGNFTASGVTIAGSGSNDSMAWSPDTSKIYVNYMGDYYIVSRSGNTFTWSSPISLSSYATGYMFGMSVHPSGNYIAMGSQGVASGYFQPTVIQNPAGAFSVISGPGSGLTNNDVVLSTAWSPDGTFLAIGTYSTGIAVYGFNSGTNTFTPATISGTNCGTHVESVAWTTDGNYLAAASLDSTAPLCIFSRSGTTFARVPVASALMPAGLGYGVAFTH